MAETGKPIDRSKLLKRFKDALRHAHVRAVRFHDLRHTFGTRMAAQGVPMRVLQDADYAPSELEAEWVEEAFRPPAGMRAILRNYAFTGSRGCRPAG